MYPEIEMNNFISRNFQTQVSGLRHYCAIASCIFPYNWYNLAQQSWTQFTSQSLKSLIPQAAHYHRKLSSNPRILAIKLNPHCKASWPAGNRSSALSIFSIKTNCVSVLEIADRHHPPREPPPRATAYDGELGSPVEPRRERRPPGAAGSSRRESGPLGSGSKAAGPLTSSQKQLARGSEVNCRRWWTVHRQDRPVISVTLAGKEGLSILTGQREEQASGKRLLAW